MLRKLAQNNVKFFGGAKIIEFIDHGLTYEKDSECKTICGYDFIVLGLGSPQLKPFGKGLRINRKTYVLVSSDPLGQ